MIPIPAERPAWLRYVIAVLAVALAAAARLWPLGSLGTRAPYVTFYPAVILAALYGGLQGGLLATALSALGATYFWIEPVGYFTIRDPADWMGLVVFLISCTAICWVADAMQRAQARAARAEAQVKLATERSRTEEQLQRYRLLAGHSRDVILYMRRDGGLILEANAAAVKLYGYTQDEFRSLSIHDLRGPGARTLTASQMDDADAGGILFETVHRRKDGGAFPVEVSSQGATIGGERALISVIRDITERKRVEEALRQSEEAMRGSRKQLQDIIDGSPGVVFVKDLEGRFITANRTFERLLGTTREELAGKTDYDIITRELAEKYREHDRRVAETGEPIQVEEAADLADARQHVFLANKFPLRDANGKICAVCAISTDITDWKLAEERLRQSQKLESIGLLAGGVAHDFNNLLVGVIGNASLAQELLPPDHPAADLVQAVVKTGEQAAYLTRQMLAYSGKGKFVVEPLDLSALIPEMCGLVRPSIPKKIDLRLDLAPDLAAIEADRGQIQQVFMNLALNAAEAIGSHEGSIAVRTGVQDVDEPYRKLHPELAALAPGKCVYLEVRDTGCGMDQATKAQIFDPFFSTKFIGRGLGLAAVSGIVRGHNGAIVVDSAPGQGSCFTVWFPAAGRDAASPPDAESGAPPKGAGAVMVVDDEPLVREMARKALERQGYTVLLADSGLAAVDILRTHRDEITLVVLDLSMPHMSGEEALPELRKILPAVKVVVSSGYNEAETMAPFVGQQVSGYIQKPYTFKQLAEKVKASIG